MDSNNYAENDPYWSKKHSCKKAPFWRWFLAGTLLNVAVTSLIVGTVIVYVRVELQSVTDQLLFHEDRLYFLENLVSSYSATPQQGTPEMSEQTLKTARLRMRRDHNGQTSPEHNDERNYTVPLGIYSSRTDPLPFRVFTCRDGNNGRDGRDGKDGEMGRNGIDGRDGKDGRDGRDCQPGPPRGPGQTGDAGLPGVKGPPGEPGEPGPPGERGRNGEPGVIGERGRRGEPGAPGKVGLPGEPGIVGERGQTGETGEYGAPGRPGARGEIGRPGAPGVVGENGPPGRPGRTGPVGPPGKRGLVGEEGPRGAAGAPGPPGEQGPMGIPGPRGRVGDQGNIESLIKDHIPSGPTYIRWGRTTCANRIGTEFVYQGFAAGSAQHTTLGGSADPFCLPSNPDVPTSYEDGYQGQSRLYGMEYEVSNFDPFSHENSAVIHNRNVPCAVCRLSSRGTQALFPARNECPDNWSKEYRGYLMSDHNTQARQKAVCVDEAPEVIPNSQTSADGALLYLVETACGSLQCPPYVSGREIACTICSI